MTNTLTPTETLAAIAAHRASAVGRRTELLAERRNLAARVLIGDPDAQSKATQASNELRGLEEMLEDLEETERRALAAIEADDDIEKENRKVATIYAVMQALTMRDTLAEGIDAKLADLLADLRKFDALSLEIRGAACRYGRHETIAFFTPKAANEILFDRLVSMQSLPVMVGDGHIGGRATIADISREAGARMFGHLAELLPPEKRPVPVASRVAPQKKDKRKAKPARVEDDVVDDLPPLEEV
jgi:hypothetical protein